MPDKKKPVRHYEDRSVIDQIKDLMFAKRGDPEKGTPPVGRGGQKRSDAIDKEVEDAVKGRRFDAQHTDSSQ